MDSRRVIIAPPWNNLQPYPPLISSSLHRRNRKRKGFGAITRFLLLTDVYSSLAVASLGWEIYGKGPLVLKKLVRKLETGTERGYRAGWGTHGRSLTLCLPPWVHLACTWQQYLRFMHRNPTLWAATIPVCQGLRYCVAHRTFSTGRGETPCKQGWTSDSASDTQLDSRITGVHSRHQIPPLSSPWSPNYYGKIFKRSVLNVCQSTRYWI